MPQDYFPTGAGIKWLSTQRWYGGGYCKICGHRGEHLIPRACRFWDPDDGWKMGVLCTYCADEAAMRGPQPNDYAVLIQQENTQNKALKIDVLSETGDLDSAYSNTEDDL